jgi:hypothetical protein
MMWTTWMEMWALEQCNWNNLKNYVANEFAQCSYNHKIMTTLPINYVPLHTDRISLSNLLKYKFQCYVNVIIFWPCLLAVTCSSGAQTFILITSLSNNFLLDYHNLFYWFLLFFSFLLKCKMYAFSRTQTAYFYSISNFPQYFCNPRRGTCDPMILLHCPKVIIWIRSKKRTLPLLKSDASSYSSV